MTKLKAPMLPIPKDALFIISTGEWSDYSVVGVFRALENIDPVQLRDEWLLTNPDQGKPYHFEDREFLAFVTRKGLIEQVPFHTWHLCDYGCVEEMFSTGLEP